MRPKMGLKRKSGENYPTWRCGRSWCRKEKGFLVGTWFEGTHLTLKEIFHLLFMVQADTFIWRNIFRHATSRWVYDKLGDTHRFQQFFREICVLHYVGNKIMLGGDGKVVEIDETVISRRKYERGRLIANQQWVFGLVERGSCRCALIPIEKRNADTLLPLIHEYVLPGTVVMSDCWAAYGVLIFSQKSYIILQSTTALISSIQLHSPTHKRLKGLGAISRRATKKKGERLVTFLRVISLSLCGGRNLLGVMHCFTSGLKSKQCIQWVEVCAFSNAINLSVRKQIVLFFVEILNFQNYII